MSHLQLTFLDVQHGSACHIETPAGKHFMFDLGTGDFDNSQKGSGNSPLKYLKNTKKIEKLDGVFITHPHRDHIDDIENFDLLDPTIFWHASHLTDDEVYAGNKPQDSTKIEAYLKICKNIPTQLPMRIAPETR